MALQTTYTYSMPPEITTATTSRDIVRETPVTDTGVPDLPFVPYTALPKSSGSVSPLVIAAGAFVLYNILKK